jgi:hypothetical protein
MRDANAEKDMDKYYILFTYGFKMVIPYLSAPTRANVQADYDALQAALSTIEHTEGLNQGSKDTQARKLKAEFADAHNILIFASLSRLGIIKIGEDGAIKFDTLNIDQIAQIVRSSGGIVKKIAEVKGIPEVRGVP